MVFFDDEGILDVIMTNIQKQDRRPHYIGEIKGNRNQFQYSLFYKVITLYV